MAERGKWVDFQRGRCAKLIINPLPAEVSLRAKRPHQVMGNSPNGLYNLPGWARLGMAISPPILQLPHYPDAISIELNGNTGAGVATNTSPIGGLFKSNPNIKEPFAKSYLQGSAGFGSVYASADVIVTEYYILGANSDKVVMNDFTGTFYSGSIGIDLGISLSSGVSFSSPRMGAQIIGISKSLGVGVGPTIVSGGAYWGQMDFYSNHAK